MTAGRVIRAYHPLLFAAYPALFLYAGNMEEATLADAGRALLILVPAACLLWMALRATVKERLKAALITSLVVVATFSFGYTIEPLRGAMVGDYLVGRALFIEPLWVAALVVAAVLLARSRRDMSVPTTFANILSLALVGAALLQAMAFVGKSGTHGPELWRSFVHRSMASQPPLLVPSGQKPPNIYYIILDEYCRADVLKNDLGFDNSGFVRQLQQRGFLVSSQSVSNYSSTYLSLSSSLNMDYLQSLQKRAGLKGLNPQILGEMIHESHAVLMLKRAGYSFAVFPSNFRVTDRSPHADRTYRRRRLNFSEFERVLFDKSLFAPLLAGVANHRRDVLYNLEILGKPEGLQEPVFVFAHIMAPHPPYVFDRTGKMPPQEPFGRDIQSLQKAIRRYTDQIVYTNRRVLEAVDRILRAEEQPPVIIVQGDHGFRRLPKEHPAQQRAISSILNAYYLPPATGDLPGPGISPVNSFRIVFNRYLGARYPLLPDQAYYTPPGGRTGVFFRIEH